MNEKRRPLKTGKGKRMTAEVWSDVYESMRGEVDAVLVYDKIPIGMDIPELELRRHYNPQTGRGRIRRRCKVYLIRGVLFVEDMVG